jgi:clan AA aspartic protease
MKVWDKLTLKNYNDTYEVSLGRRKPENVRQLTTRFLADTGCDPFVITEDMQKVLQLPEISTHIVRVAGGEKKLCKKVGPVEVCWHDRSEITNASILPGQEHPLLGASMLESLNLIVDPGRQCLAGEHGSEIMYDVY